MKKRKNLHTPKTVNNSKTEQEEKQTKSSNVRVLPVLFNIMRR